MMTKALFLDRDGIINVDHGYVSKIEDFQFIEGIFDLVKYFSNANYLIFIVTNQSGIGRGYYKEKDFSLLTKWMLKKFLEHTINITQVYHCPHSPKENCHCRKPEAGMIEEATKTYSIDLLNSWIIGDKQSDINLTLNAGIGHSIAISQSKIQNADYIFPSILEFNHFLEANEDIISL